MYIKKIRGKFGILKDEELVFKNGLNVICRENEWGKTTFISLLKTMFYGLNTSKRDRKDFLSEKTKYVYSGEYAGEMTLSIDHEDLTIIRKKSGKKEEVLIFLGEKKLEIRDIGREILGVSEEAYQNSALIENDNRLISSSEELYELILSLTTTGDSEKSYQNAMKNLKNMKSAITKEYDVKKINEEVSLILKDISDVKIYETEILKLAESKKVSFLNLNSKKEEYEKRYRAVAAKKVEAQTRADVIKADAVEVLESLKSDYFEVDLIENAEISYQNYSKILESEYETRVEANQRMLNLNGEIDELNRRREKEISENSNIKVNKLSFVIALIFGVLSALSAFVSNISWYIPLILSILTIISLISAFIGSKPKNTDVNKKYDELIARLKEDIAKLEQSHSLFAKNLKEKYDLMVEDIIKIGGGSLENKDEIFHHIKYSYDVNKRYKKALEFLYSIEKNDLSYDESVKIEEVELSNLNDEIIYLQNSYDVLKRELSRCELKYEMILPLNQLENKLKIANDTLYNVENKLKSIEIASEVINEANENLAARLSPEISKKASEYMSFVTDGKYCDIILEKDFNASLRPKDDYIFLNKLKLSQGTKDQLYMCLRLAICDVLLKEDTPIILDDPFVFYDKKREEKMMELLEKIAKKRQIIVFTCRT